MSFAEDQHPVGDLGPGGEHESFGVSIRARASGLNLRCGDANAGQDRVEGFGELPGAVADQDPFVPVTCMLAVSRIQPTYDEVASGLEPWGSLSLMCQMGHKITVTGRCSSGPSALAW